MQISSRNRRTSTPGVPILVHEHENNQRQSAPSSRIHDNKSNHTNASRSLQQNHKTDHSLLLILKTEREETSQKKWLSRRWKKHERKEKWSRRGRRLTTAANARTDSFQSCGCTTTRQDGLCVHGFVRALLSWGTHSFDLIQQKVEPNSGNPQESKLSSKFLVAIQCCSYESVRQLGPIFQREIGEI